MKRAVFLLSSLLAVGCAGSARIVASPDETDAYRKTRASYTVEDRLVAAEQYLADYPTGRFADDVRARFAAEEARFYAQKSGRVDGLDWYLLVLPRGPHAAEASLQRADYAKREEELTRASVVRAGWSMERRLARAEASRKQVVELVTSFLGGAAATTSWRQPVWELPREVMDVVRGYPGPGKCDDLRCARFGSVPFSIPQTGGGLDERALVFDAVVTLTRGGVTRLSLRGPELFSRLFEAQRARPVDPDKERARLDAVGFAEEVISGTFEARLPAARCEKPIRPPEILRRECAGLLLRVIVGDTTEDDQIELSTSP